jgi:hypothetical protein
MQSDLKLFFLTHKALVHEGTHHSNANEDNGNVWFDCFCNMPNHEHYVQVVNE